MSTATTMDGADLMAFCAQEFQTFFSHIGGAIKQFKTTGQLPETVFKEPAVPQTMTNDDKRPKIKRRPTAFNMFVKAKMEEFKIAGLKLDDDRNGNQLFTLAVAEWKKLEEEQKQEYTRSFKASLEETNDHEVDIDPHEPEAMVPSMVLDFGPGPSVTAPPSPSSSASAQEVENGTTIQDKKRKIRSAEAQPLMPSADEALPAQGALVPLGHSEKKQKKKKKDKKQA